MNNKTIGNIFKGDKVIWMVFFFLCMISIVEVYSASSSLSYKSGNFMAPVLRHIGLLGLGLITMICMLKVKCKYFKIVTPFVLLPSLGLLVWVLVAGQSTNGASRWINFIGIQFQPSEIAKGAVVLAVAQILSAMQTPNGADRRAFKYVLTACSMFVFLICLENLSTAMLLCITILCMMIIGRVPMSQIGKLVGTVLIGICLIFAAVMIVGQDKGETAQKPENTLTENVNEEKEAPGKIEKMFHRADTWKARIDKFLNSKPVAPEDVDLDKDAQVAHANIIEEMGIWGAVFVAMLYIILLFRAGKIANRCENTFPAFLCMGLAIMLVVQALFNMAVAVGLAPVTGQPLPLISRGGTSTIINCLYLGIILSISRTAKKKDLPQNEANIDKFAAA